MSLDSYAQSQRMSLKEAPAKEIEGWALIELARRLDQSLGAEQDYFYKKNIHEVLRLNWRIWTLIQAYLVDPKCTIPEQLRDNLMALINFIDQRTIELMSSIDSKKMQSLININRQVGSGLLGITEGGVENQAPTGSNDNTSTPDTTINKIKGSA